MGIFRSPFCTDLMLLYIMRRAPNSSAGFAQALLRWNGHQCRINV
jgi:hypothetical protein